MKIAYFTNQTALKSEPVWQAFLESCQKLGITPVENSLDADYALIWSVLWQGRMKANRQIYEHYRSLGKNVFICEVGSLIRGKTWKIAVNNITQNGTYACDSNFIPYRAKTLGLTLRNLGSNQLGPILIAGQHDQSLQWTNETSMKEWIVDKIKEIRQFSDQEIYIRPHPRNLVEGNFGVKTFLEKPIKIPNTYDEYNLSFGYKTIINFNSGVGIWAGLNGIPLICDKSSLAYDLSIKMQDLVYPVMPDRSQWFEKIVHTEWLIEEIAQGIPLRRLLSNIA